MRICSVPGCNNKHQGKGYCSKHYWQYSNYGYILERTYRDKNEIIIVDDISRIILYNKLCDIIGETIIDTKYVNDIKDYKWFIQNDSGYVVTNYADRDNNRHQIIKLHQAIIALSGQKVPNGYEIDHKDRNILNNLEDNLRVCTNIQNSQNRKKDVFSASKYKGVSWRKRDNKWQATITINTKSIYLGVFSDEEEAAKKYNEAAKKYFGEFAVLNII